MADLLDAVVTVSMLVIIVAALFSITPRIIANFGCEAVIGDTDNDYVEDSGENWTETPVVTAWKQACNDSGEQNAIVPILISLVIVVAVIVMVANILRGRNE